MKPIQPLTGIMRAGTFGRGAYEVLTAATRTKAERRPDAGMTD
jgi:hypothetical protein